MDEKTTDTGLLERVLLPLIAEEKALAFLRQVIPQVLQTMEEEVVEAAKTESRRRLEHLDRLRQRIKQVDNLVELENITDALFLPALLFDPNSTIWEEWGRPELQQELARQKESIQSTKELLQHLRKGSLQYHQVSDQLRSQEADLLELYRHIFLERLAYEEEQTRQHSNRDAITWQVQTRLQIPIVVHDRLVDYADAEIQVTASTRHAFLTRAFALVVIPKDMGLIQALRRINLIRHFLPSEIGLIVLTERADYAPVLKQHQVYVHTLGQEWKTGEPPAAG